MRIILSIFLFLGLCIMSACNNQSSQPISKMDSDDVEAEDTIFYYQMDSTEMIPDWNPYHVARNLLQFHTTDSMRVGTTYQATLAMGKDISIADLTTRMQNIVEPGGSVKVRDSTQEIGLRMSAMLEQKGSKTNPYFEIELLGGPSNIRTYDKKQHKMVWEWNVTPKMAGRHQLILSISRVDDKNDNIGSPETRKHQIMIFASGKRKSLGNSIAVFLEKNWQWMIGAVGLPIFIAWFTTRRKKPITVEEKPLYRGKSRKRK